MKLHRSSFFALGVSRVILALLVFSPSVLFAHPGHYHPDETDEFDFFQATFFHSHGIVDFLLLGTFLINIAVVLLHSKPKARLFALVIALCSMGLIPLV
jgi:hypothetical protein